MYGQTTSGKTYTMLGTADLPGVLPCAIRDLFNKIEEDTPNTDYKVWISYMEIYNETIHDLLIPPKAQPAQLKIKEDRNLGGPDVAGLKRQQVWNFQQAIILMNFGEEHRTYKATNIHEHSSRSHTIFRIYLQATPKGGERRFTQLRRYSCLNLVDLAGSERLTEFDNRAQTIGETQHINKSLFILSHVIKKLADGKEQVLLTLSKHIPYRESKLTRILSLALGGNSLTTIICTVSPALMNFYQTLSTLRFATRAKTVKNRPHINELGDEGSQLLQEYKDKIAILQAQLEEKDEELLSLKQSETNSEYESMNGKLLHQLEEMKYFYQQERAKNIALRQDLEENYIPRREYNNLAQKVNRNQGHRMEFMEEIVIQLHDLLRGPQNEQTMKKIEQRVDQLRGCYFNEENELKRKYLDKVKLYVAEYYPSHCNSIIDFLASTLFPQTEESTHIEEENVFMKYAQVGDLFQRVKAGFESRQGMLSDQEFNTLLEKLKETHQQICEEVDELYEKSKLTLEQYYREKVSQLKNESLSHSNLEEEEDQVVNKIQSCITEHNQKLSRLRGQFEAVQHTIQEAYVGVLREVTVGSESERSVEEIKEEVRYAARPMQDYRRSLHFVGDNESASDLNANDMKETGDFGQSEACALPYQETQGVVLNSRDVNVMAVGQSDTQNQETTQKESLKQKYLRYSAKKRTIEKYAHHQQIPYISTAQFGGQPQADEYWTVGKEELFVPRAPIKGKAFVWGSGKDGRCGNSSEHSEVIPSPIQGTLRFSHISSGYHHTAAVTSTGGLMTWGRGTFGQLGLNSTDNVYKPTFVDELKSVEIVSVECGWQHTMALSSKGKVFSWGYGEDGQLGHNDVFDYVAPKQIEALQAVVVKRIACGHSHSAAISNKGELFLWGCNPDQRLMGITSENQLRPSLTLLEESRREYIQSHHAVQVSLGVTHTAVITANGQLFTAGSTIDGQLALSTLSKSPSVSMNVVRIFGVGQKAKRVSCGDSYSLVLDEFNQVYAFGKGSHGRLGLVSDKNQNEPKLIETLKHEKIEQISAGCRHSAAVTSSGRLYCWGFNFYEQLGIGEGDRDYDRPTLVEQIGPVKMISCGYFHTVAISS